MMSTEGFFYKIIKFCVFHDVQGQQNFKLNIFPYANVDVYTQPCREKNIYAYILNFQTWNHYFPGGINNEVSIHKLKIPQI